MALGGGQGGQVRLAETRAAVRLAPRDVTGSQVCLRDLSHGGCPRLARGCARGSHGCRVDEQLRPEVEVFLVQYGGPRERRGVAQPQGEASAAAADLARWRSAVAAEDDQRLLAGPMGGAQANEAPPPLPPPPPPPPPSAAPAGELPAAEVRLREARFVECLECCCFEDHIALCEGTQ